VGDHERIDRPGDMLIFQAGRRPIYGSQILYFADPELSRRASIPPPTDFFHVCDGEVRPGHAKGEELSPFQQAMRQISEEAATPAAQPGNVAAGAA
jgi:hypothetical protein